MSANTDPICRVCGKYLAHCGCDQAVRFYPPNYSPAYDDELLEYAYQQLRTALAQARAERDALVERVRGVVTELHTLALKGSKTGRPDYAQMLTQEQLWRWYQALAQTPPQQTEEGRERDG